MFDMDDMTESKLTCQCCNIESVGNFQVQFDDERKKEWDEEHAKRLELRTKQELIKAEFEKIAAEHNSHWYNLLSKWYVRPRANEKFIDVCDFTKDKPIKSAPYDRTVMGVWLSYIHRKPIFEYIECPVCHGKNYLKQCRRT